MMTLAAAALLLGGSHLSEATREALLMGTYARVVVWAPERDEALRVAGLALDALESVEAVLSNWTQASEVSRLNRSPVGEPAPVSGLLASILEPAFALARDTGFAFDPAIGALTDAWAVRRGGRLPAAARREEARRASGEGSIRLDPKRRVASRHHRLAALDTDGFGKGAALDQAALTLRAQGTGRALLDLGGQTLALGGPFEIGIADPRDRRALLASLALEDASVATSGNSERGFRVAGRAHGHILDPRSGAPAADFGSVTVVAPTGLAADALATALYVMGPREGLAFALARPGIEALYALVEPDCLRLRATPGFAALLLELRPGVDLEVALPGVP